MTILHDGACNGAPAMRERDVRGVVRLVASRESGVRCDDGRDESAHGGQDDGRVEGGVSGGGDELPQKQAVSATTIGDVLEAAELYGDARVLAERALRSVDHLAEANARVAARFRDVVNRASALRDGR